MQQYNPFSLEGKTILVTGASSGIGKATAIECSKMGARVVLTSRNLQKLETTYSQLVGDGHIIICADLSSENDIIYLIDSVPFLDGIVHAAGIHSLLPIKFVSTQSLENIFSVNTFSGIHIIRQALKKNKLKTGASLVFISSISSTTVVIGGGLYSASKAAIEAFSKQCALELSNKKIRSNSICPGIIHSEMGETFLENYGSFLSDSKINNTSKYIGRPIDIAWLAIYLLSDASIYVNGVSINVDGGFTISKYS